MNYTESGITFSNVTLGNVNFESSPVACAGTYNVSGNNITFNGEDHLMVNAIDIDWNGAQVGNNTTINSTADLINWIKTVGSSNPSPSPVEGGGVVYGYYGHKGSTYGIYDKPATSGGSVPSDATLLSTDPGVIYVDLSTGNLYVVHQYTEDGETFNNLVSVSKTTYEMASENSDGLMSYTDFKRLHLTSRVGSTAGTTL